MSIYFLFPSLVLIFSSILISSVWSSSFILTKNVLFQLWNIPRPAGHLGLCLNVFFWIRLTYKYCHLCIWFSLASFVVFIRVFINYLFLGFLYLFFLLIIMNIRVMYRMRYILQCATLYHRKLYVFIHYNVFQINHIFIFIIFIQITFKSNQYHIYDIHIY